MKLLHHGNFAPGSNTSQRADEFERRSGLTLHKLETSESASGGRLTRTYSRVRWKLRFPVDFNKENERLVATAERFQPDVILVENSKVITRRTLATLKGISSPVLAFISSDDVIAPHNLSWSVRWSFPDWDVFFTTKTFNVPELRSKRVRNPVLIRNIFDPTLHRPMSPEEVGPNYERFDLIFIGTFEHERCKSINFLVNAGLSVAVYGNPAGLLAGGWNKLDPRVTQGGPVYAAEYTRGLHHGKISLCFLRKINRDRITHRSIELPACARPMLAEKTEEHDAHFVDGEEYIGFVDDDDMLAKARALLADDRRRQVIGLNGRRRCLTSGYDVGSVVDIMLAEFDKARGNSVCSSGVAVH